MRRLAVALLAVVLLAGCATSGPRPAGPTVTENQPPRRCSPADPDRWAWFCVVGQILYGAAAFFTPVNEVSMR
ncbi:MAG TPA: hypothetical protein VID28_10570 [Methylomirabilota bacterium]|jgi:hypothetical protein